ncbi:hypothetical protein StDouc24_02815 [Streptococcus thermophilus]|uniref:hypothetical protein n=1 Tax=Streptococcus thermophilus TaxID=1308 RepID=UPI001C64A89A|nr:hypothetical protein [Streptococcus thermophilus]MBW7797515.1 hypothetical protein [Streptococcus thermophilus]
MAFSPFQKSKKILITDDLFLELTWEEGKSPDDDSELLGLIEGLDHSRLPDGHLPVEDTLPYISFHAAELLFQELKAAYGQFNFQKVAVCHLEGKEAVSEGEVFASPFVIDRRYQNLLVPLIQAILTDNQFSDYSYQDKKEYFENQIYPIYKQSLGVPESALPLFPAEGEAVEPVRGTTTPLLSHDQPAPVSSQQAPSKAVSLKKIYLLLGAVGVLTVGALGLSVASINRLTKQNEKLEYLYQEQKKDQHLMETEHEVDVFNRYFLPNYYSGNKEALATFLDAGDAKFTTPKEGTLQSVILEKITYDEEEKTYQSTYVLSVKQGDESSSHRLSFSVKPSDSNAYGYVVTTEPKETDYLKPKKTKTNE